MKSGSWLETTPVAHRGFHDPTTPENSVAAFAKAVSHGMAIECDVKLTADGEVVVFHDATTARLTGESLRVDASTLTELQELRLLDSDERIPTLAEMLDLVAGRVPLLIEVKPVQTPEAICRAVWRLLRDYDGEYAIQSFDPRVLVWFRRHAPRATRVQLAGGIDRSELPHPVLLGALLGSMAMNAFARPDAIGYDIKAVPSGALNVWRRILRCPVLFWTITTPDELDRAREAGGNVIVDIGYFVAPEEILGRTASGVRTPRVPR